MTEYRNNHIEKDGEVSGEWVDNPGEKVPFRVVRVDSIVQLRGKGIGDVVVDLERFLREGMSPRGRLRFTTISHDPELVDKA